MTPYKQILNKIQGIPPRNEYGKQASSLGLLLMQEAFDVTKHLPLYLC